MENEDLQGLKGATVIEVQCYHYILDSAGQPRHVENAWEVEAFLRRKGHVLAEKRFNYRGYTIEITTQLAVHNPMIGDVPPLPRWVTAAHMPGIDGPDDDAPHWSSHSAVEAMATHREVIRSTRRFLKVEHRERRPSPTRRAVALRRIAAGQDVLRRKESRVSLDRWFKSTLKEAFGDMAGPEIARVLGLPSLPRKRGRR